MKEIRNTKLVEVTEVEFIADDGMKFDTENECKIYERRLNEKRVKKDFNNLNPKRINIPIIDWFACDYEILSVTLKNEFDFEITAQDYFALENTYMDLSNFKNNKPKNYPCEVVFVVGYDWVDIYGTKEELKQELINSISIL